MTAAKNRRRAEWLLATVIVARSTSYLFPKTALDALEPFTLLSLRFLSAFFLLSIPFRKKLRGLRLATIVRGAALGGSFFLGMAAGTGGLCRTSTTTASLLENTSIILVPPPSGEQRCGWRWYAAASALFCSLWRKGTFPPSGPPFSLR